MNIAVEISMYPLADDCIPHIQAFIDRLKANERLQVLTNTMSTQVYGEYDEVFAALQAGMRASFTAGPRAVFVTKFLGGVS
jgi:uncharacterized protein YqgV (UPF0045/DUF77 family)